MLHVFLCRIGTNLDAEKGTPLFCLVNHFIRLQSRYLARSIEQWSLYFPAILAFPVFNVFDICFCRRPLPRSFFNIIDSDNCHIILVCPPPLSETVLSLQQRLVCLGSIASQPLLFPCCWYQGVYKTLL